MLVIFYENYCKAIFLWRLFIQENVQESSRFFLKSFAENSESFDRRYPRKFPRNLTIFLAKFCKKVSRNHELDLFQKFYKKVFTKNLQSQEVFQESFECHSRSVMQKCTHFNRTTLFLLVYFSDRVCWSRT